MLVSVIVKHAGKTFPVSLDTEQSAMAFKEGIFQITGVPPSRMKVMIKGILKDSADMGKLGLAEGQVVTVIGTAGPLPSAPSEVVAFAEDMDFADARSALGEPPGLVNLGNTCYMNASLQALRVIPELSEALESHQITNNADPANRLTHQTKVLFQAMSRNREAFAPAAFLATLRQVSPQFAEISQHGGYAQQDADEMWTQTVTCLNTSLKPRDSSDSLTGFVDSNMSLVLQQHMICDEAPEEIQPTRTEKLYKLDCNISGSTNYMLDGIKESLDQKLEKNSPSLGRNAVYTQTSRIAKLPATLTIHMVRFYWRADIQKKAKIMRKVKFPMDLDVSDLLTDDLKQELLPAKLAIQRIDKARQERARVARKTKKAAAAAVISEAVSGGDQPHTPAADQPPVENEETHRAREREELRELMGSKEPNDPSSNRTGLYELAAVVTHKGASADSGHYIGWTRKALSPGDIPGEEDWWKFDDDKVSTVSKDQILALDGGGEASIAYILVYRSKTAA